MAWSDAWQLWTLIGLLKLLEIFARPHPQHCLQTSAKVRSVRCRSSLRFGRPIRKPLNPEATHAFQRVSGTFKPPGADIHWCHRLTWYNLSIQIFTQLFNCSLGLDQNLHGDAKRVLPSSSFRLIITDFIKSTVCDRIRSLLRQIESCRGRTDARHVSAGRRSRRALPVPQPVVWGRAPAIMWRTRRSSRHGGIRRSLRQRRHAGSRNHAEV